jgi:uncharacterized lipoprotein YmbA
MKRALCVLAVLIVLLAGCSGVIMNAEYSQLLDKTAALSAETARRAEAGNLTPPEMVDALKAQADVWQKFKDARDGKASD